MFSSRLVLYSVGSELNRVQVVLSGFSVRFFGLGNFFMDVWLYVCLGCTRACVYRCDGEHELNRCVCDIKSAV